MSFNLYQTVPTTLGEDTTQTGPSPSITLSDNTASAVDYTLTADADALSITSGTAENIVRIVGGEGQSAQIRLCADDRDDGADEMRIAMSASNEFSLTGQAAPSASLTVHSTGAVVVNEAGSDIDFRVEGDTDANLLMADASTDRVGIGTASPGSKLDVNGVVAISPNTAAKDTFQFSTSGANEGRFRIKNVDTLTTEIRAGGASYFNGGSVGIGTASPDTLLHVSGSDPILTIEATNNNGKARIDLQDNAGSVSGSIWYDDQLGDVVVERTGGANLTLKNSGAATINHGSSSAKLYQVTLADDATLALETNLGSAGMLTVIGSSNEAYGIMMLRGSENAVAEIADAGNKILQTDTDGSVCVIADGDGTYTLKNRVGASATFALQFVGF